MDENTEHLPVEKQQETENNLLIPESQLNMLLARLDEREADILALVSVFQNFTVLFSGKSGLSMVPTIMKIINDPAKLDGIKHIVPIIEKYTQATHYENG